MERMLASYALITVGVVTIFWGAWLLPTQLRQAQSKLRRGGRARFDEMFRRGAVQRLLSLPAWCGGLLVLAGVVSLFT
jgi:hypothetical protein